MIFGNLLLLMQNSIASSIVSNLVVLSFSYSYINFKYSNTIELIFLATLLHRVFEAFCQILGATYFLEAQSHSNSFFGVFASFVRKFAMSKNVVQNSEDDFHDVFLSLDYFNQGSQ